MVIMFTSPMGTENIVQENQTSVVSCIPLKKEQDAGVENVRLVTWRSRLFYVNRQQFLHHYWGERLRFLICDAVKCDVGCIVRPKPNGYRGTHVISRHDVPEAGLTNLFCETQVQTRLQHVWATALETYDAMSRNTLKFCSESEKGKEAVCLDFECLCY